MTNTIYLLISLHLNQAEHEVKRVEVAQPNPDVFLGTMQRFCPIMQQS